MYRDDELYHYGVKGMKWGVRKKVQSAGDYIRSRNAHNKNYSDRQRKNDRALYGNGAERRINRRLNKGYGLQGARHFEVERKERKEARKQARDRAIKRGARAAKRLAKTGVTMWAYDQVFNGGRGTRAVKNGMKVAASLGVYAFKTARQAYWDTHPTYTVD